MMNECSELFWGSYGIGQLKASSDCNILYMCSILYQLHLNIFRINFKNKNVMYISKETCCTPSWKQSRNEVIRCHDLFVVNINHRLSDFL